MTGAAEELGNDTETLPKRFELAQWDREVEFVNTSHMNHSSVAGSVSFGATDQSRSLCGGLLPNYNTCHPINVALWSVTGLPAFVTFLVSTVTKFDVARGTHLQATATNLTQISSTRPIAQSQGVCSGSR